MERKLITIKEASTLLGVHPQTLRRWEKSGFIKSFRVNNGWRRYDLEDLRKFLNGKGRIEEPSASKNG